jgi:hypothetical protein
MSVRRFLCRFFGVDAALKAIALVWVLIGVAGVLLTCLASGPSYDSTLWAGVGVLLTASGFGGAAFTGWLLHFLRGE